MKKGVIIAGFATIGKTYLSKKFPNILDLESSCYKYDYSDIENINHEELKGTIGRNENKDWPHNYYVAMGRAQNNYDVVFVQLHPMHLKYFDENKIEYYTAYPSLDSWKWVKQRGINRGNNEKWLNRLEDIFEEYYIASKNSKCKEMFIVNEQISLENILKENKFI